VIDNVAPEIDSAITGCAADAPAACVDLKTIRVNLSEPVKGAFLPIDFLVGGNLVVESASACTAATFCDQVVLTLLDAFDENDRPVVDYQFRALPTRTAPADGALNAMPASAVVQAIDGIVPALPSLDTVTQNGVDATGAQISVAKSVTPDGFVTNQESPTFSISGLESGYMALVAMDTNGVQGFQPDPTFDENGQPETAADSIVASCVAEGASVGCATSTPFPADDTYPLMIASRDGEGNLSQGLTGERAATATLVIDSVAPLEDSFIVEGPSDLRVNFTEALVSGRDFAEDWFAKTLVDTGTRRVNVSAVGSSGSHRTVTIGDAVFTTADVDQLFYSFAGDPNARYQDAAGNYLGDFMLEAPAP
jgi:hypothetical protein